jgi:4'-phosphopantetheinyl transferase
MTASVWVQLLPTAAVLAAVRGEPAQWMTAHEQQRLQAMAAPARRDSFIAGHWQARQLAAQCLQIDAARIGLDAHPDGRPRLLVDALPAYLQLSLSHSGDHIALAVAGVAVGIDLELPRKPRDWLALARFAFSNAECTQLQSLDTPAQAALFQHYWALKEAHGKRSGAGLQPAQTRLFTAQPTQAESADACSWRVGEGALALCVAAGTAIIFDTKPTAAAQHWRFVATAGA